MHPVMFVAGLVTVYAYGVCMVLGLAVYYASALIPARRHGRTWDELIPMVIGIGVGGIVLARLSHLLFEPAQARTLLNFYGMFQPGTPGNIVGMLFGGYIGGVLIRWRFGLPSVGNYFTVSFAAASVIWRIGCYMGGCCYGIETDLPWAIYLHGALRHPTQVYEGLFNIAMLGVFWWMSRRPLGDNALAHLYIVAYCAFRFVLETIRVYPDVWLGLTGAQLLCAGILLWEVARVSLERMELMPRR